MFDCEADILEGLEHLARQEILEHLGKRVVFMSTARNGALRFRYTGNLNTLLALRSVVALYLVITFPIPRPRALLGHQHFTTLIRTISSIRNMFPANTFRTFYLSAAGSDSSILVRLKEELANYTGLTATSDEGDLLLRLRRSQLSEGWEVLVRTSPRPLATRAWRVCNLPGSLNATLAYAMMRLTHPSPIDRLLNIACGAGTLLIERLSMSPVRSAIGCDISREALSCAQANIEAAGYTGMVQLKDWDARKLPLSDASVDVICADLPFGQLVGSHQENEILYPQILTEMARIADSGARIVLLTHEVRLFERVYQQCVPYWHLSDVVRVRSGGMTPRIYLFQQS